MSGQVLPQGYGTEPGVNPKEGPGRAKPPMMSVIPQAVLAEVAVAMSEGALKYGRHNYRQTRISASVYVDAATRHLAAFWEGRDIDPDSGLSEITKAIAGLFVLRDTMLRGEWDDDRPPPSPEGWLEVLQKHVAEIRKRHPDPRPPAIAKK